MKPRFDQIPDQLKAADRWVNWHIVERDGRPTKVPFTPGGREAKSNDPTTWSTLQAATTGYQRGVFSGVGFVLGGRFVGIDLDHCRDANTGELQLWAQKIIDEIDSYTEVSPSGTGVHIFTQGELPEGRRRKDHVEAYGAGRYFTVTGNRLNDRAVEERTPQLRQFHARVFGTNGNGAKQTGSSRPADQDADLIRRAQNSRNGGKFSRLWFGDWQTDYQSQSEADLGLCSMLAFWTGRDGAAVDRLFRQSGLMRDKWERADYREKTIATAIDKCAEVWTPEPTADRRESHSEEPAAKIGWELQDLGTVESWETEPLEWDVEPIIPKGSIGFLSGAPKTAKSFAAEDLSIQWAQAHAREVKWLGRFPVAPRRVLYVAREDPARRLKERALEINHSYGFGPIPEGVVFFLIRERFHLTNSEHVDWLREEVSRRGIDVLILDVLNRMVPDLDELNAKDMAVMVSILEALNRDLGITILLLDHTRKPMNGPKSGRDRQEPNPFDLKGSVAKYGCADFMICLARTEEPGRLQMYCENKDTDERPHFLVDVSPKGSSEPKFRFAGDIERFANDMKAKGDANREKVLEVLTERWMTPAEIAEATGLASPTVRQHLARLESAGKAQRDGKNKGTKWRKYIDEGVQESFSDFYGDANE